MKNYSNRLITSTALIGALLSGNATADVFGLWKAGSEETGGYLHVDVQTCGELEVCGTILKAFDEHGQENPVFEHLGKQMIWDMHETDVNRWKSGKIWAPDTGKTYSSRMSLQDDVLKVSGCLIGGLLCRSMDWQRVE